MSLPLQEVIRLGKKRLEDSGVKDSDIDAKALYCYQMGLTKTALVVHWNDVLQDNQCEAYFQLIEKRASRVPLQHIVGEQEFMGLAFKVSKDVLIPRQDTETMVEDSIELIKEGKLRGQEYLEKSKPKSEILDLCTGSGAIGISLGKFIPTAKITCSDVSEKALDMARKNSELNKVKGISFIESDMFEGLKKVFGKKKFDFIISNPPYIKTDILETLEPEVKDHEPAAALDGGEDGLKFYKIIGEKAPEHLKKGGVLMLEIGYDQKADVKKILAETEKFEQVIGLTDLTGKDRIIVARLKAKKKTKK